MYDIYVTYVMHDICDIYVIHGISWEWPPAYGSSYKIQSRRLGGDLTTALFIPILAPHSGCIPGMAYMAYMSYVTYMYTDAEPRDFPPPENIVEIIIHADTSHIPSESGAYMGGRPA